VSSAERVRVEALDFGFFRVFVRYGFKDDPDIPAALAMCGGQGLAFELMESSFFLGRETLIPRRGSPLAVWRERLFIVMFRNARSAAEFFSIPANRVVEFGTQVEL
jgi:KUP system potassium uptake protein